MIYLSKMANFNLFYLHLCPHCVIPFEFCKDIPHPRTIESLGYCVALIV